MKRPLIGLAISAALFLLSFGLCGAGGLNHNMNAQGPLVITGLLCLGLSIVGGLVSVVWLVVALIRGRH